MAASLRTYALRFVAAAVAPTGSTTAGAPTVQSGMASFASVPCYVEGFLLSAVTAAGAAAEFHPSHAAGLATAAATLPATPSPSPAVCVSPTGLHLSLCRMPRHRRFHVTAFIHNLCYDGEREHSTGKYFSNRCPYSGRSAGFRWNGCGSCSLNTCCCTRNAGLSNNGDSTRGSLTDSSRDSTSSWSGRGWYRLKKVRIVGQSRNVCTNATSPGSFTFSSETASVHEEPAVEATRSENSLPAGDSPSASSLVPLTSSPSEPYACSFSPLTCFTRRAPQQRDFRTTAYRLAASAQPCTIGSRRPAEGDWLTEKEQIFSSNSTSTKAQETAPSQRQSAEAHGEAFNWDIAQVRRVPPARERANAAGDAVSTQNKPVSAEGSQAQATAGRVGTLVSSGSRTRRSVTSERRAPPLLRVTDAAAERIREIVEMYNGEAANAGSGDDETLRNGYREEGKSRSDSPCVSKSKSSNKVHNQGGRRRAVGIRIGLKKRGCSGLSYTVDVATRDEREEQHLDSGGGVRGVGQSNNGRRVVAAAAADEVIKTQGGDVVLAGDAIMFLVGTELDYIDTELERKFVFRNPNEKQACGCGKSFMV